MTLIDRTRQFLPASTAAAGLVAFAAGVAVHWAYQRRRRDAATTSSTVRSTTASGSVVYESSRAVDEYLLFHYLPGSQLCPYELAPVEALDFPKRCADLCAQHAPAGKRHFPRCTLLDEALNTHAANEIFRCNCVHPGQRSRALDVGCAVGRHSFEMAKAFDEVNP